MHKPRLTLITDAIELAKLQAGEGCIDVPKLIAGEGGWYVDADDLRIWRSFPSTSEGGK